VSKLIATYTAVTLVVVCSLLLVLRKNHCQARNQAEAVLVLGFSMFGIHHSSCCCDSTKLSETNWLLSKLRAVWEVMVVPRLIQFLGHGSE